MKKETVEEFLARSSDNKITQIGTGVTAGKNIDPQIRYCKCGCEGNFTAHQMRRAERGLR